jgi:hypothetical protein
MPLARTLSRLRSCAHPSLTRFLLLALLSPATSELLSLLESLKSSSRTSASRLQSTFQTRIVRVRQAVASHHQQLTRRLRSAPFVRLKDKVAFVCGLWCVAAVCYSLGAAPHLFYRLYTALVPVSVLIRLFRYKLKKWSEADIPLPFSCGHASSDLCAAFDRHYYLFDFCYFGELHAFPTFLGLHLAWSWLIPSL